MPPGELEIAGRPNGMRPGIEYDNRALVEIGIELHQKNHRMSKLTVFEYGYFILCGLDENLAFGDQRINC